MEETMMKNIERQDRANTLSDKQHDQEIESATNEMKEEVYSGLFSEASFTERQLHGLQCIFTTKTNSQQSILPSSPYGGTWPAFKWHCRYWWKSGRKKQGWIKIYFYVLKELFKRVSFVHLFHRFYESLTTPSREQGRTNNIFKVRECTTR